jgi:hypothetical protein
VGTVEGSIFATAFDHDDETVRVDLVRTFARRMVPFRIGVGTSF